MSETVMPGYARKLAYLLDPTQLPIIGGNLNGKLTSRHTFAPNDFPERSILSYGDPVKFAMFQEIIAGIIPVMLCNSPAQKKDGYIEGIGGNDLVNLPKVAVHFAEGASNKAVIRTVFAGTACMPLRGLSYLLPPLMYAEELKKNLKGSPQIQFIFANHIPSQLNGLDFEVAGKESLLFHRIAREYIQIFFPDLIDNVVFLEDTPLEASGLGAQIEIDSQELESVISDELRMLLASKSRTNPEDHNHLRYGAAHRIFHDTPATQYLMPFADEDHPIQTEPEVILSFGGIQEFLFYRIRHALKKERVNILTLQYFTSHHTPPYLMELKVDQADVDIGLSEFLADPRIIEEREISKSVEHDIQYLLEYSANGYSFKRFMDEFK